MFIDTFLLTDADWNTAEVIQPLVSINSITLLDGIVDVMHAEQALIPDASTWDGSIPDDWGWNTVLDAKFNGTLNAGSIEADVNTTSEIRIKRRVKGTFRWYTMYIQPVEDLNSFTFEWYDKTAASNVTYEYAYVPVINGSEGSISTAEILSSFNDYFLVGLDRTYHLIVEAENQITYNQETGMQTTIGRKYPYFIKNGNVGYYSGSLRVVAVGEENCEFDWENGELYRKEFDQFLTDGEAKILKDWQGNNWLVFIVDAIPRSAGDHWYLSSQDISWIECGDVTDIGDLYDNGFIDTDIDR